jgi:hypothetical protein
MPFMQCTSVPGVPAETILASGAELSAAKALLSATKDGGCPLVWRVLGLLPGADVGGDRCGG